MRLRNRLQNFVMGSGERSVLLVQRDTGLPLFHPNLFATTQVRNRSLSLASMDAQLTAINVLLTHCAEQKIDLVPRFLQGKFLKTHELDALRDFCQHAFERRRLSRGTAVVDMMPRRPGRRTAKVSRQCQYSRLSTIASYLKWLAHELLTHRVDEQSSLRIERMFSGIQSRRPSTSSRGEMARNKALSKDQISMLFHVIAPDSSENPFVDPAVRWRNCLMIYLLNYLGSALLWVLVYAVLMMRGFEDANSTFSRQTLWNPMNVIFSPSLLNEKGLQARHRVFLGLKIFVASLVFLVVFIGVLHGLGSLARN